MSIIIDDEEFKEKLIKTMKKEVKQIMEEAVTRKFVHEESSSITSLCGAVEACLSHGLKRRTLGLFKTSSTTALIHKVGKSFESAAQISKLVQEVENSDPNRRSSSSGDSTSRLSTTKPPLQKKNSGQLASTRYLWIRLALLEKVLAKIIDYLVENASKYYEKDSLVGDPDYGTILSSLLVGPCALDYSKMKTVDHLWTDPPADELVQRHRISSGHLTGTPSTPPTPRRPGLHFRKPLSTGGSSEEGPGLIRCAASARDYVESLHQNHRATLLYGKNNVHVQPKEHIEAMPGYLSLHQTTDGLVIKWTPNHLMNGCRAETNKDKRLSSLSRDNWLMGLKEIFQRKRHRSLPCLSQLNARPSFIRRYSELPHLIYWEYALNVKVEEAVYLHCHLNSDSGGTIVLVGQDGTQYPPVHFPRGPHLLAFLSCLENGLLPHGQLDPPLWSQRGKGKVFPRLRRKGRMSSPASSKEEEESSDYVFRIITTLRPEQISHTEMMSPGLRNSPWMPRMPRLSSHSSSTSSSKSLSLGDSLSDAPPPPPTPNPLYEHSQSANTGATPSSTSPAPSATSGQEEVEVQSGESLELLCVTMKRQIISRAFYGWLAHCRHLRTVRTHLAGLVHSTPLTPIAQSSPHPKISGDATDGLSTSTWSSLHEGGRVTDKEFVFNRVYWGGVELAIRKEVWPYLLEHYAFGSSTEERQKVDAKVRQTYETTMSEWLAVEAIVRQKDKEAMAMNLAKLSSGSAAGDIPLVDRDRSLSNEVFEEGDNISIQSVIEEDEEIDSIENGDESSSSREIDGNSKLRNGLAPNSKDTSVVTPDEGVDAEQESSSADTQSGNDAPQTDIFKILKLLEGISSSEKVFVWISNGVKDETAADDEVKKIIENGNCGAKDGDETEEDPGEMDTLTVSELAEASTSQESRSTCISPASSQGGVYSNELLETFGLNLHRIDKDVQRCDRNYPYFTTENLEKLRNIMCTYVWEHLDIGYMQGMCDLVAPLLVIMDEEAITYSCFRRLMNRMSHNFPHGGAMDQHFANMRSLIQILDSEMFELMHQNGDYTHFYFCYRWFLLDFKREMVYDDVFVVWETIWAARHVASSHFVLFIALALVQYYRDIILDNSMNFTDIIKFFNEMAERHDARAVLRIARSLVQQLQTLIDNK